MLKGFVSGEEKDIKRIPMKGRNLSEFDATTYLNDNAYYVSNRILNSIPAGSYTLSYFVDVDPSEGSFAASVGVGSTIGSYEKDIKTVNDIVSGYVNIPFSITDADDGKKLFVRFVRSGSRFTATVTVTKVMLNLGDQALPYEPYGYQEGWEVRDNQDRLIWGREDELQTATGTLPFKGYALPVKVKSLLGNTVQNGTPAPDNIITPEMCGVRTGNLLQEMELGDIDASGRDIVSSSTIRTKGYIEIAAGNEYTIDVYQKQSSMYMSWRFYDAEKNFIGIADTSTITMIRGSIISNIISSTTTNGCFKVIDTRIKYVRFRYTNTSDIEQPIMFMQGNEISTTYEPYGWKVPFENHGENLFDKVFTSGYHLSTNGNPTAYTNNARCATLEPIDVSGVSAVTFSFTNAIRNDTKKYMYSLFDGSTLVTRVSNLESGSTIDVSQGDKLYLCVYSSLTSVNAAETTTDTMLNPGSTPKPYSPYLNATIPVYLGEVPTVRRVKKLVLTGEETGWSENTSGTNTFRGAISLQYENMTGAGGLCSHNIYKISGISADEEACSCYRGALYFRISKAIASNVATFKQWLSQQYAAGHPVTVWYVLANEQTGIVNEPLCKISTYADELNSTVATLPEIPTTTGQNTLTVDTTLAPSSLTVKGHIKELT